MLSGQTKVLVDPQRGGSGMKVFLVALVMAITTAASALLGAAGTGTMHDAWRYVGLGQASDFEGEQRRQARLIGDLDRKLGGLINEVTVLSVHDDQVVGHITNRLVDIDKDIRQIRAGNAPAATTEAYASRDEVGTLKGNLAQTRIAVLDLRSSIEEGEQAHRQDIANTNKRIDRIEGLLAARELTASIPTTQHKRRAPRVVPGWAVTDVQNGGAIIAGERGRFEVRPGIMVPGLGRVASVRQRASGWIVVTDKGVVVQH